MQNGELTHALGESAVFPKSSILILPDDLKHFYADVRFIEERSHPFLSCLVSEWTLPFSVMVARTQKRTMN